MSPSARGSVPRNQEHHGRVLGRKTTLLKRFHESLAQRLRGGEDKGLRISCPEIVQREYLPALIAAVRKRIPDFHFTLVVARIAEIEGDLRSGKIEWFPVLELASIDLVTRFVLEGYGAASCSTCRETSAIRKATPFILTLATVQWSFAVPAGFEIHEFAGPPNADYTVAISVSLESVPNGTGLNHFSVRTRV